MDFTLTEEQSMQVDACARFARERCTEATRRAQVREPAGAPSPLWSELVALGLPALVVPEDRGGLGRPPIDAALALQALGSGVLLEPVVDSALVAATVLARAPRSAVTDRWLERMAEGAVVVPLRPEADASTVHVDGAIRGLARHAGIADAVLAWWSGSGDADAARLVLVEAGALERTPWRDVDGTPSGRIQASAGEAIPLADGAAATAAWQAGAVLGQVGWMAEGLGLARAALDLTAEYLRTRQQFGQPLARFQVLAHRMADLLLEWELAQSLVWAAAMDPDGAGEGERAARADTGTGRVLAAQVKMHRLLRRVGQETIQLHGGIGMTDAYALAQLVRRMLAIELALGSADAALARYAALARDD